MQETGFNVCRKEAALYCPPKASLILGLKDPGLRLRTKGTGQVPFLPTPEGGGFRAEESGETGSRYQGGRPSGHR
jgi:hypothetical protein